MERDYKAGFSMKAEFRCFTFVQTYREIPFHTSDQTLNETQPHFNEECSPNDIQFLSRSIAKGCPIMCGRAC